MDPGARDQGSAIGIRDAGLRRLTRARRWLVVGSVAVAGALAGFVAEAKPGRSSTTTRAGGIAAQSAREGSGAQAPAGGSAGAAGGGPQLTPPSQAPAPAPATPSAPVVSGGS